jgi:hypothetical protein
MNCLFHTLSSSFCPILLPRHVSLRVNTSCSISAICNHFVSPVVNLSPWHHQNEKINPVHKNQPQSPPQWYLHRSCSSLLGLFGLAGQSHGDRPGHSPGTTTPGWGPRAAPDLLVPTSCLLSRPCCCYHSDTPDPAVAGCRSDHLPDDHVQAP